MIRELLADGMKREEVVQFLIANRFVLGKPEAEFMIAVELEEIPGDVIEQGVDPDPEEIPV